jgi:predicted enzyme related to lactoylglutathione lyase
MPTRLVHVVIDAADHRRLALFWAAALGWELTDDSPEEATAAPVGFRYPGPAALPLTFVPASEPKTVKNRLHLDLATQSAAEQQDVVSRLLDLGAQRVDIGQGDVPWVVMGDPEGNEFCVLEPRPVYSDTGPIAAVLVDSADPASLAGFWELAGGWARSPDRTDLVALRSPAGLGPYLEFLPSQDPRVVKNRVHLDVAPERGEDQAAAVDGLLAAGATRLDIGQGDVPWVVMADPEGNEFCVLTPR